MLPQTVSSPKHFHADKFRCSVRQRLAIAKRSPSLPTPFFALPPLIPSSPRPCSPMHRRFPALRGSAWAVHLFSLPLRCVALPQQSGAVPPRIITPPRQSHARLCLRLALRCNAASVPSVPVRLLRCVMPRPAFPILRFALPQRGFALQYNASAKLICAKASHRSTNLCHAKALPCIPYAMQIISAAVLRLAISLLL